MSEVDEFLDQLSEDIDVYVARIMELERRTEHLEMRLKSYDDVRDTLQDTLFAAQRTAKQIVAESQRSAAENEAEAQNIIAAAREEAQKIIQDGEEILKQCQAERERVLREAELDARDIKNSIIRMKREKHDFIETNEALLKDYQAFLKRDKDSLGDMG